MTASEKVLPVPGSAPGVVMGILNVTADSFSDGGRYLEVEAATAHGRELIAAGADIIDIGGESTRPGAHRVDPDVEAARILPVVTELAATGVPISVDTMRASIAERAIAAGATLINDVSGGRADPDMVKVAAATGVPWILMHWRPAADEGDYRHTGSHDYRDVVSDVRSELGEQIDAALHAGVAPAQIIIDPGLGFAKNAEHNWALLAALPTFLELGFPVLIGASRKRFLGALLGTADTAQGREFATATVTALALRSGVWGVRVHDVAASVAARAVVQAWDHAQRAVPHG